MSLTKIVCTAGPSCDNLGTLKKMHRAGMNVLRVNLSHTDPEEAARMAKLARKIAPDLGLLFDTKGPELRTGMCSTPIVVKTGDELEIRIGDKISGGKTLYIRGAITKAPFSKGDLILIADGTIELKVTETGSKIKAKALNDGVITGNKNVSIPGSEKSTVNYLSKKDVEDIKIARELDVDFVAASFIRSEHDVLKIRKLLHNTKIMLFSKIEHAEAVKHLPHIIKVSDGIMVARGDLGLSLPLEQVPILQKSIIEQCNFAAKPVITATQVLDSMTSSPRPTRAEVGDVVNAVFDGTDAIMLSGETARGAFPVKAVETLAKIASYAENKISFSSQSFFSHSVESVQGFIAKSAYIASFDLNTDAIITHTESGRTARLVSQYKPKVPIITATANSKTYKLLSVTFGAQAVMAGRRKTTDEEIKESAKIILAKKMLPKNATAVVTSSSNTLSTGMSNILRIGTIEELSKGRITRK